MSALVALLEQALGIAQKVAPNVVVKATLGGMPATFSAKTILAGLKAFAGIDLAKIETEFNSGQIVTAGMIAVEDVLKALAPEIPGLALPEEFVAILASAGEASLAHNSGEDEIGARPEGDGSVAI